MAENTPANGATEGTHGAGLPFDLTYPDAAGPTRDQPQGSDGGGALPDIEEQIANSNAHYGSLEQPEIRLDAEKVPEAEPVEVVRFIPEDPIDGDTRKHTNVEYAGMTALDFGDSEGAGSHGGFGAVAGGDEASSEPSVAEESGPASNEEQAAAVSFRGDGAPAGSEPGTVQSPGSHGIGSPGATWPGGDIPGDEHAPGSGPAGGDADGGGNEPGGGVPGGGEPGGGVPGGGEPGGVPGGGEPGGGAPGGDNGHGFHDNRSGLGDGTNPGQGAGTDNSPNQGTLNPGQANGSDNGNGNSNGNDHGLHDNRSGLGDNTNPGQGAGTDNSPNQGTLNPGQAHANNANANANANANSNANNASPSNPNVIEGGNGKDTLTGTDDADQMFGYKGKDTLTGAGGDDHLTGGTGDDTLYGGDGNDTFHFAFGDGSDIADGGMAGGWTDTIQLEGMATGPGGGDWTIQIDQGSIMETGADHLVLSDDSAGTITLSDGSSMAFTGMERVEW